MTAAASSFWLAGAGLVYAYLAYPMILRMFSMRRRVPPAPSNGRPPVSVVVAAFNEAPVIVAKASNVLSQLGAGDELIVVSDGSTDGTDAEVTHIEDPRLRLLRQDPRQGKNAALNRGVEQARGNVVVFTDADALFSEGALDRLLALFDDSRVGLVSGLGLYGRGEGDTQAVAGAYVRYETLVRHGEAALGFMAGVDGALYAMRRELYQPLPLDQVHDLLHPIQVALAGRRVAFEPEAYTVEPPSPDATSEWRRQVRIIAQGFRVLWHVTPALVRRGCLTELWMLASHRLLRWMGWLLLLVALAANLVLQDSDPVLRVLLLGQLAFFALAAAGFVGERLSRPLGTLAVPYYFCLVSFAGFVGLLEACRGRAHSVWPTGGKAS